MATATVEKPHAVCIPYPTQGHISPMLNLAKLLHHRGFHITFVHSHFNYARLLKSRGPSSLGGLPDFRFESIPDGLPPPDNPDATQDIIALSISTANNCFIPFRNLLAKLNGGAPEIPPVTCVIYDGLMSFALEAAQQVGVPGVAFWTVSACSFICLLHFPHLLERGFTPFKGTYITPNIYILLPCCFYG